MESSPPLASPRRVASVTCHAGCAYAESFKRSYPDWIWCMRPDAQVRIRQLGEDCRRVEEAALDRNFAASRDSNTPPSSSHALARDYGS